MNDLVALPDTGPLATLPLWDPFLPEQTKWCWQGWSIQTEVQHLAFAGMGPFSKPLAKLVAPLTVAPTDTEGAPHCLHPACSSHFH